MRITIENSDNAVFLEGFGVNATIGVVKDALNGNAMGELKGKPVKITIEPEPVSSGMPEFEHREPPLT